ncbi:glycosyl hydrolase family protein [Wolffia australiana]
MVEKNAMNTLLKLALLLLTLPSQAISNSPPFACDSANPSTSSLPFCQRSLSLEKRAEDLVSRLTLQEKISQLGNTGPAIPRLGIPSFQWWSEGLHGVSNYGRGIRFNGGAIAAATSFPQVILAAAAFDPLLWYRIGQAVGTEARAFYNGGQADGLTFWTPNINIFRDPRWGRGQETPGEDPLTVGKYAVAYVRGLQGDSFHGGGLGGKLLASACCKHLTAYDLDNWKGVNRVSFDAKVTAQDMADTYQPPFRSCVEEGQASGIMCSYNSVNGIPTCADPNLLSATARQAWGFNGYITSDCDAVATIFANHSYVNSPAEAVASAIRAGVDVDCGPFMQNHAAEALQQRKLFNSDIDRALRNQFMVRMRLGLFDGNPQTLAFGNLGPTQVCMPEHQALALDAARAGLVLLKNEAHLLPLSKAKLASLAVIGPNSNSAWKLLGDYAGPPCSSVTPLQALKSYVGDVRYLPGCDTAACAAAAVDDAAKLAGEVDQVVLFMGLDQEQEFEDLDRVDLVLPRMQEKLITRVAMAAKRPVILIIISGGPVDISFAKINPSIGAIVWAGYPGQAGGTAISEVLFGDHNPGGKLPMTWYPQSFTAVPMTDMRMRADAAGGYPGRTYRFYNGKVVYPFGYGLSYTGYSYRFVKATAEVIFSRSNGGRGDLKTTSVEEMGPDECQKLRISAVVRVKNEGDIAGKHPVMVFARHSSAAAGSPVKQLVGFEPVYLGAGEEVNMTFGISPCLHLARAEPDGSMVLDQGSYFLVVGDQEHPLELRPLNV